MTVGIPLSSFSDILSYVPVHQNTSPIRSFDPFARFKSLDKYIDAHHHGEAIEDVLHCLPANFFLNLGTDKGLKAMHSAKYAINSDTDRAICETPGFDLVRKIKSSIWRWGYAQAKWNEIVDAWRGFAAFDLGIPGFEVTLDYTTGYNERGFSRETRTYLDGVFGFLVHWQGKHVMTIGFSISKNRRLLLQQVQAVRPTGNRWMFRLPANRMEFICERLRAAFPRHDLYVADGSDTTAHSLAAYERGLAITLERYERQKDTPGEYRNELEQNIATLHGKIRNLQADRERIIAAYRDLGRFSPTQKTYKVLDMRHYKLAA